MVVTFGYEIDWLNKLDDFTDEELWAFCSANKDLRIERDADKNLIVMAPVGGASGFYEKNFIFEIEFWVRKHKKGLAFSSSTGFLLPNGAMRSPDACWVSAERWTQVLPSERERFLPITPDFVVEVVSASDRLAVVRAKMEEWIESGARLAWCVDVKNEQTFIYRENGSVDLVAGFDKILSGEMVLEGFEFDLNTLRMM